jgi:hypothetical protein
VTGRDNFAVRRYSSCAGHLERNLKNGVVDRCLGSATSTIWPCARRLGRDEGRVTVEPWALVSGSSGRSYNAMSRGEVVSSKPTP